MKKILDQIKRPFRWIRKESRTWKPPGFRGLSVYRVSDYISQHYDIPTITEKASAISYNFIMSIPPTLLFVFTLIPSLPFFSRDAVKRQLHGLIHDIIPAATYNQGLINFVDSFIDSSKIGLISFTFLLSLFFASNGVMGLMRSFNMADYVGFEKLKGLKQRWEAIKLTLMLFALVLVTMVLLFLQANILEWLGIRNEATQNMILVAKWLVIGGLIFFSYAFIYRYAPSTTQRWHFISPGAVVATVLSVIVTLAFAFFVENFGRYNILYGSIGTVMMVMVMVFLNALVAFFGFILNLSIHVLCSQEERGMDAGQQFIN